MGWNLFNEKRLGLSSEEGRSGSVAFPEEGGFASGVELNHSCIEDGK